MRFRPWRELLLNHFRFLSCFIEYRESSDLLCKVASLFYSLTSELAGSRNPFFLFPLQLMIGLFVLLLTFMWPPPKKSRLLLIFGHVTSPSTSPSKSSVVEHRVAVFVVVCSHRQRMSNWHFLLMFGTFLERFRSIHDEDCQIIQAEMRRYYVSGDDPKLPVQ